MSLTEFIRDSTRKNGGIIKLGLICADEIAEITFGINQINNFNLKEGCKFATYDFREDEAEYRETVSFANGAYTVQHELKFMTEKMSEISCSMIMELIEASSGGIVAAIVSPNNTCHIAGYSKEFLAGRPLRVASVVGTSGRSLKDGTGETVTLQSTDVSKAMTFADYQNLFNG